MQVVVDRTKCQGIGMGEAIRPDVFEVADDGELLVHEAVVETVTPGDLDNLQQAVQACPTQALGVHG